MAELSKVCKDEDFWNQPPIQYIALSEINPGNIISISHVDDNFGSNMIRLAEMGFTPSKPIEVLKNSGNGPLIIKCRGVQLMIGRDLSKKIMVNEY